MDNIAALKMRSVHLFFFSCYIFCQPPFLNLINIFYTTSWAQTIIVNMLQPTCATKEYAGIRFFISTRVYVICTHIPPTCVYVFYM